MGKLAKWFRRPSHLIATALGAASILILVGKPLPNGDGFVNRLSTSLNPANNNPLAIDAAGNNILSITAAQLVTNIPDALGAAIPAAIVAALGRIFKF